MDEVDEVEHLIVMVDELDEPDDFQDDFDELVGDDELDEMLIEIADNELIGIDEVLPHKTDDFLLEEVEVNLTDLELDDELDESNDEMVELWLFMQIKLDETE